MILKGSLLDPPTPGKRYMTFINAVNHPFSRGTVVSSHSQTASEHDLSLCSLLQHAVSSDPTVNPAYDPRYFEHEYGQ